MKQFSFYRNLHKPGLFSIKQSAHVVDWQSNILLSGNIKFHISEKGRLKVVKNRRKNVHAWIKSNEYFVLENVDLTGFLELWYNPYFTQHFYCIKTGGIVIGAEKVILTDNKAFVHKPVYQ
jgi:hypothetical protein